MQLGEISKLLNCEVLCGEYKLEHNIEKTCASELMSNVLTCVGKNTLLITGLNNIQVIRTAEMSDIPAIIFVQGIKPNQELLNLARENDLVIMVTDYSLFTVCGILYNNGLRCGFDEYC